MKWPKTTITIDKKESPAIAPQVISASRSTDIPAFYANWFIKRLKAGYIKWINPFNQRPQYISLTKVKAVVFWTKNPLPLIPYLTELDRRKISYYFQFTLNDYEKEKYEPRVPKLEDRINAFITLSKRIGKERVIWRFDPLLLTEEISIDKLLQRIKNVGDALRSYTSKLVFSFVDISSYSKVKRNLKHANVKYTEFDPRTMKQVGVKLANLSKQWNLVICTCGEKIDLSEYGIKHNKCVDDELLLRISNNDQELSDLFGRKKYFQKEMFDTPENIRKSIKDPGQREECGCVFSKDIGQYNTCPHLCVYCYANTSEKTVRKNMEKLTPNGDSIVS
ncbi:MAG: DUF1848 domain-containing protein [Planctomycetota bacterium]|nr:MAG: DUF1848 domain-containing protein [Planctomycetota bacterium]